ncbi:hypothetical protein FIE12Z_1419 [Fusarium flagelliforme]|uniref:Uncharacterized protein n=2 Tax=Fusarium flagelliforme TaxID=2675880 RepID=A0A395N3B3_9HYPO|nr:hypothetical protein FIE12Z_1419 [Fusarium flagelliforme]
MTGHENTLDISPRATVGLALWYTSFGAVFTIFFCVGCLLRGMNLMPTVWLLVFLLPAASCFITAALLAGRIPYLLQKDSSEATDDAPDNEQAADGASLNSPPPTYKAGQRLESSILPQAFTNSGCLSVSPPSKK